MYNPVFVPSLTPGNFDEGTDDELAASVFTPRSAIVGACAVRVVLPMVMLSFSSTAENAEKDELVR
jgi:hypothetical protein